MPFIQAQQSPWLVRDRIVAAPWGDEKTGKTRFALTCPEPIRVLNWNFGLEGTLQQFLKEFPEKWIEVSDFKIPMLGGEDDHIEAVDRFEREYAESIEYCAPHHGTVVVDNGNQLWDSVQRAKLALIHRTKYKSKPDWNPMAMDYGDGNEFMSRVFLAPEHTPGINAIFLHGSKAEYVGDKPSGRRTIDCWKGVPGAVQMAMQTFTEGNGAEREFKMRVNFCRLDPQLEQQVLVSDYDMLAAMLGIERPSTPVKR